MPLSMQQKGVAKGALTALVITLLSVTAAVTLMPASVFSGSVAARVSLAGAALLLPLVMLLISIGRVANHRFDTPEDINGSGLTAGSDRAKLLQALLQNTLEQTVVAIAIYLAWAMLAPVRLLPVLPVAAVLFATGRFFFFSGYDKGAPGRAMGFGMTFYPSVLMTLALGGVMVVKCLRLV